MKKQPMDTLTRAIKTKERVIRNNRDRIDRIMRLAKEEVALIERRIAREQILLDALKRGTLKP